MRNSIRIWKSCLDFIKFFYWIFYNTTLDFQKSSPGFQNQAGIYAENTPMAFAEYHHAKIQELGCFLFWCQPSVLPFLGLLRGKGDWCCNKGVKLTPLDPSLERLRPHYRSQKKHQWWQLFWTLQKDWVCPHLSKINKKQIIKEGEDRLFLLFFFLSSKASSSSSPKLIQSISVQFQTQKKKFFWKIREESLQKALNIPCRFDAKLPSKKYYLLSTTKIDPLTQPSSSFIPEKQ